MELQQADIELSNYVSLIAEQFKATESNETLGLRKDTIRVLLLEIITHLDGIQVDAEKRDCDREDILNKLKDCIKIKY